MSLIKWTPFFEPTVGDEFDKFFENWPNTAMNFAPAIDVYQDDNNVVVEAPLAGIDPEKVDISVENDVLTIRGQSEKKSEVEDKNYYRKEVRHGSFYRSIQLPTHVIGDQASADYQNGVLKILLPKATELKSKTIKINVK